MKISHINKIGSLTLCIGSLLLAAYSIMLVALFPMEHAAEDFTVIIQNPYWIVTTTTSLLGLLLLMFSFAIVYASMYKEAGNLGFFSIIAIEGAYFFQAAKVTWEIFIYPAITAHPDSLFLIQKQILWSTPGISLFRAIATGLILLGTIIFSITILRSRFYSLLSGILFFIGALLYGAGSLIHMYVSILGITIFSVSCFLIGIKLYSKN